LATDELLVIANLAVSYHGVAALKGIDITVGKGELVAVLGPNGAGKSTLAKTVIGALRADSGDLVLDGASIARSSTRARIDKGIGYVPEGGRVFPTMTVEDNLVAAAYRRGIGLRRMTKSLDALIKQFPMLDERRKVEAGTLSGGQRQMLAIARGLVSDPRLLLMDEPSSGLAPLAVLQVANLVRDLAAQRGMSVLWCEQNPQGPLESADRFVTIVAGNVVHRANRDELEGDDQFADLYLGTHDVPPPNPTHVEVTP
jgi:branched-chain amino acid transport system ATP-binding protein